jgi:putative Mg2+ transporter-C (MgtC) family protein
VDGFAIPRLGLLRQRVHLNPELSPGTSRRQRWRDPRNGGQLSQHGSAAERSNLPEEKAMLTEDEQIILLRTALAALLGFVIGWERKAVGAPGRGRVITLTTMTTAALTALGVVMYPGQATRVVAGIVTGIGFLGAGVMMRSNTGEVRGQATAAAIWAMGCIGIVVGAGHAGLGIIFTLMAYVIIAWDQWPIVTRLNQRRAKRHTSDAENQQSSETEKINSYADKDKNKNHE